MDPAVAALSSCSRSRRAWLIRLTSATSSPPASGAEFGRVGMLQGREVGGDLPAELGDPTDAG